MRLHLYETTTGRILSSADGRERMAMPAGLACLLAEEGDRASHYVDVAADPPALVAIPPPPTVDHVWAWAAHAWVVSIESAKKRRIAAIRREGLALMQTRYPAITDMDTLALLRQIVLSIAPAARALTADMQWLQAVWQAGVTATAAVNAASTVAEVDAVVAVWP